MSELGRQMEMAMAIAAEQLTAMDLQDRFGISRATMRRDVAELRRLGVDVVAVPGAVYEVRNWSAIRTRVKHWFARERERDDLLEYGLAG